MQSLIDLITTKLSESSTWRGMILLVTALGVQISPDLQNSIITMGLALVGVINVVRTEKKK